VVINQPHRGGEKERRGGGEEERRIREYHHTVYMYYPLSPLLSSPPLPLPLPH